MSQNRGLLWIFHSKLLPEREGPNISTRIARLFIEDSLNSSFAHCDFVMRRIGTFVEGPV